MKKNIYEKKSMKKKFMKKKIMKKDIYKKNIYGGGHLAILQHCQKWVAPCKNPLEIAAKLTTKSQIIHKTPPWPTAMALLRRGEA